MIEYSEEQVREWARARRAVDAGAAADAATIVEDVRSRGVKAVREHGVRLGDIRGSEPLFLSRDDIAERIADVPREHFEVLSIVAERIGQFAAAQRSGLTDVTVAVPGGSAGHRWIPVDSAGVYAPGGRYPLPSSVLMTAVTARAAGVRSVLAASPRPSPTTLAACAIAKTDGIVAVGGAQGIAALAFGIFGDRADVIAGPGNRWVTAAKKYLYGEIGIEGLAGPSEILVVADSGADPELVAADLIAQAEHDTDAIPMLISTSESLLSAVHSELGKALEVLETADTARVSLARGLVHVTSSLASAVDLANMIAPEHLSLHLVNAEEAQNRFTAYGSLFVGPATAESFADYGVGPNHVLPTGGSARFQSGLSVMSFLRSPTWLQVDDPGMLIKETEQLALLEGLHGHAVAARLRSEIETRKVAPRPEPHSRR